MTSVWDTDMFKEAWGNMTEEQKKEYSRIGELVYNTIDYETGEVYDNSALELQELLMAIKSGLIKKNNLTDEETKLLQNYYSESDIEGLFK